jgi:hypothetical protein
MRIKQSENGRVGVSIITAALMIFTAAGSFLHVIKSYTFRSIS